jgi:hypothetical protein
MPLLRLGACEFAPLPSVRISHSSQGQSNPKRRRGVPRLRFGLRWIGFLVGVISAAATAPRAADWPQWGGGDARVMSSSERGIPAMFIPGKKGSDGAGIDLRTTQNVKWVARLGDQTYSSPVVAAGKVFIGTNDHGLADPRFESTGGGVLLCLDEATGELLWRLVVPQLTSGRKSRDFDAMGLGICSSPSLGSVDGRPLVFFGAGDGVCYAFDALTTVNPAAGRTREPGRRAMRVSVRDHRHAGLLQEPYLRSDRPGPATRPGPRTADMHRRDQDRRHHDRRQAMVL